MPRRVARRAACSACVRRSWAGLGPPRPQPEAPLVSSPLRRQCFGRSPAVLVFRRTVAGCVQRCVCLVSSCLLMCVRCVSKDQRERCLRGPKGLDSERDPSRQRALRHPLRPRALLPRPRRLRADVRPRPPRGRGPDGNWRERVRRLFRVPLNATLASIHRTQRIFCSLFRSLCAFWFWFAGVV